MSHLRFVGSFMFAFFFGFLEFKYLNVILKEGDPVVALHPDYEFSYAPGQIVRVSSDMTKLLVKFYDYKEAVVLRHEVYKMPRVKYQIDVENIVSLEKRWVGQNVIARNNTTKAYEPGIHFLTNLLF